MVDATMSDCVGDRINPVPNTFSIRLRDLAGLGRAFVSSVRHRCHQQRRRPATTPQSDQLAPPDGNELMASTIRPDKRARRPARNGEGGIRTLDGGIHPHNALAGRRLQPLGHFSAAVAGYPTFPTPSRFPLQGEESADPAAKMSLPAPPSYPGNLKPVCGYPRRVSLFGDALRSAA